MFYLSIFSTTGSDHMRSLFSTNFTGITLYEEMSKCMKCGMIEMNGVLLLDCYLKGGTHLISVGRDVSFRGVLLSAFLEWGERDV